METEFNAYIHIRVGGSCEAQSRKTAPPTGSQGKRALKIH
jgi:hypothetical protein